MTHTPRTSIIMPVYNTGGRVVDAIRSVLAQTDEDFELLILIDASPDDSSERIAQFLSDNPDARVRVFDNTVNRGVSAVRNQGLAAARGEWISFIDSDDAYRPDFLTSMHRAVSDANADIALCAHRITALGDAPRERIRVGPGRMTGYEAALRLLADTLTPYVWDKLFRASLFDDVRFAVDIKRAEDALVVLETLTRARTLIVITDPLYDYTVDAGGLTWGHITPVDESDRLVSVMTLASRRMRDGARVRRALATSTTLTYLNNAQQVMASNGFGTTSDLEAYRRRISWSDVARALRARPTVGAAALLFKMNHRLYRFLYRAYVERAYGIASSDDARSGAAAPSAATGTGCTARRARPDCSGAPEPSRPV